MSGHIDGLRLRAVMGKSEWGVPRLFGPDGWKMVNREGTASVIASFFYWNPDSGDLARTLGQPWIHASMTRATGVPSYEDLCRLKRAVWGDDGWAYQYFVPPSNHLNIHPRALHLWGRADDTPAMPDFAAIIGSI